MRFNSSLRVALSCLALVLALAPGKAAVADSLLWNEAVHGDLSNDQFNPDSFAVSLGANSIIATGMGTDRDYFTLTLPDSTALSAINLVSYVGSSPLAFIAVQSGTTFTESLPFITLGNLLGWTHFGPGLSSVGTDILDDVGDGFGAIGFTGPLPGGQSYTFWMQQDSSSQVTYHLDFVVVAVPAPPVAAMFALMAIRGRRR